MIHTPPVTFSYTIIHRNSQKRKIDLSILSLADNSINLRIHQEVHDTAGTLLDTDTAILTCKAGSPYTVYIPGTVPTPENSTFPDNPHIPEKSSPENQPHFSGITAGL